MQSQALWRTGAAVRVSVDVHPDRRNLVVCVALVLLSIAATQPVLEMGLNDDWSYTYTARALAETGRLQYVGWASAMIGIQAWVAALVVRLVGFSFTAVRLTTGGFAVGCAVLLYKINRASGLNPAFACLGTLALVISPLFIPLAASFMTDVPALFFLLACLYCGLRAMDASDRANCVYWASAAVVSGLLGGTVRQLVWGVPILIIPVIASDRRHDRRVVAAAVVLMAATFAAVAACMVWLSRQPYFEWDPAPRSFRELASIFQHSLFFVSVMRTGLLLMLPVLIVFPFGWWPRRRWPLVTSGALAVGLLWSIGLRGGTFLIGNIVTRSGVLPRHIDAIGVRPILLPPVLVGALWLVTIAAAASCMVALLHGTSGASSAAAPRAAVRRFLRLTVPFATTYVLVLLFRSKFGAIFDRYLLVLMPAATVPLLWLYQHRVRDRVPLAAWLAVGLFGAYGVATTHDYFARARARLAATSLLMADGVPRTRITAGLDFDGWTEIEAAGHVNSSGIRGYAGPNASRAYRERPGGLRYLFWQLTPHVDPLFFVVYSPQPGLADTGYPPQTYSIWLPPLTQAVYIQTLRKPGH